MEDLPTFCLIFSPFVLSVSDPASQHTSLEMYGVMKARCSFFLSQVKDLHISPPPLHPCL